MILGNILANLVQIGSLVQEDEYGDRQTTDICKKKHKRTALATAKFIKFKMGLDGLNVSNWDTWV